MESTQHSEDFSNESSSDNKSPNKLSNNSKWTVDYAFKAELAKMSASEDPQDWLVSHVRYWVSHTSAFQAFKNLKFKTFPARFPGQHKSSA